MEINVPGMILVGFVDDVEPYVIRGGFNNVEERGGEDIRRLFQFLWGLSRSELTQLWSNAVHTDNLSRQ